VGVREEPEPDGYRTARIEALAMRLTADGTPAAVAVARLRVLAGPRVDLLAGVAGRLACWSQDPPPGLDGARHQAAAALCARAAGLTLPPGRGGVSAGM
jgi:hypothetical protein